MKEDKGLKDLLSHFVFLVPAKGSCEKDSNHFSIASSGRSPWKYNYSVSIQEEHDGDQELPYEKGWKRVVVQPDEKSYTALWELGIDRDCRLVLKKDTFKSKNLGRVEVGICWNFCPDFLFYEKALNS